MRLKEKHVLEFQRLYKKVYKEKISREEATKQCTALFNLCIAVYDLEKLNEY